MNISKTYKALLRIGGIDALKDFVLKGEKQRKYNSNNYYHSCLVSVIARHEKLAFNGDFKIVKERLSKLGLNNIKCDDICRKIAIRQKTNEDYLTLPLNNRLIYRKGIFRTRAKQIVKEKYPHFRIKKVYSISPSKIKMKVLGIRNMPIAKIVNGKVVVDIL